MFRPIRLALLGLTASAGLVLATTAGAAPLPPTPALPAMLWPAQAVIIAPSAPPPPRYEVVPAPPPQRYVVWDPGHWNWDGRGWIWVPGHYEDRPHPHAVWVVGHWAHRRGGWVWIPAHWR